MRIQSCAVVWLWLLLLPACAGKPLVRGMMEPGGTIYRESEQEEWGSRTTVKVEGFQF